MGGGVNGFLKTLSTRVNASDVASCFEISIKIDDLENVIVGLS
jgi:hypothetical protein